MGRGEKSARENDSSGQRHVDDQHSRLFVLPLDPDAEDRDKKRLFPEAQGAR